MIGRISADPVPDRVGAEQRAGYDEHPRRTRLSPSAGPVARGSLRGVSDLLDFCGRQEPDEAKTLTWTTAVENGRRARLLRRVLAHHLRAMEGKLDSECW